MTVKKSKATDAILPKTEVHDMVHRPYISGDRIIPIKTIKPDLSLVSTIELAKELDNRRTEAVGEIVKRINENIEELRLLGVLPVADDDADVQITEFKPYVVDGKVIRVEFGSKYE